MQRNKRIATHLVSCMMKVVNFAMAIVGIPMILYGLWMLEVWHRDMEHSYSNFYTSNSAAAWFIYTILSVGIALCSITCLGHISADSSNSFCLSCYTVIMFVLLLLETAVAADILVNPDWEKDFPEDPTGRFHDFTEFVQSNFDFFKWLFLLIVLAQGSSVLLAMALRALDANYRSNYDSDEEYPPLINHHLQPPPYVVDDSYHGYNNEETNTS